MRARSHHGLLNPPRRRISGGKSIKVFLEERKGKKRSRKIHFYTSRGININLFIRSLSGEGCFRSASGCREWEKVRKNFLSKRNYIFRALCLTRVGNDPNSLMPKTISSFSRHCLGHARGCEQWNVCAPSRNAIHVRKALSNLFFGWR